METTHSQIELIVDGSPMRTFVARPAAVGKHPAVIVGQEAFGVNSHIKNICDRLAAEGYVAIAPELFHRTAEAGFHCAYTMYETARPHASATSVEGMAADLNAVYEFLQHDNCVRADQIGAIGFCMGGRFAFLANLELPIQVAVSYYGGGLPTLLPQVAEMHAPQLFIWGGLDKGISHEVVEEIVGAVRMAQKPYANLEISYAGHGFNCDEREAYNAEAAKEAWAITLAFLANRLKSASEQTV